MCNVTELHLSPRELLVMKLSASGYTTHQIARILHCSPRTVDTHKGRAFDKIGAFSMPHALVLAHQLGLLNVGDIEPIRIPIFTD